MMIYNASGLTCQVVFLFRLHDTIQNSRLPCILNTAYCWQGEWEWEKWE